jgi:hypothetical protein
MLFRDKRLFGLLVTINLLSGFLFAQEALKSTEEEYYDFLALEGLIVRPTLNYRTLSDSVWSADGKDHVWQNNNLGVRQSLSDKITMRIYGPEMFNSFNSASPFGQNDGVLWQGKGLNSSLTGGARFEGYGFELTLKPQVTFSQNESFTLMPSNTDSEYGYYWGYGHNVGIDAPQRFGDKSFFDWSFGDSEIRYTWNTLTAGFGTQSIWLGPAYLNPILHSNNAAPYPKFDIGLRKTAVTLPAVNWYLGDVEARIWTGYLTESKYFDNDDTNNHNMIHGLALSYAPSVLPGFTLSANRTCIVKWHWKNLSYVIPRAENTDVGEQGAGEDQKMSLAASWLFPKVGLEIYGELGLDDYGAAGVKYPFHTMTYTVGLQKAMTINSEKDIYGKLNFEWNNMEMSQDFQFQWPYSFYFHNQITQGYTNEGQILGNGYSPGGNSQYLSYSVYYPKGKTTVFVHRFNPDNNYVYKDSVQTASTAAADMTKFLSWKTFFGGGIESDFFITKNLRVSPGIGLYQYRNSLYSQWAKVLYNVRGVLGIGYNF